MLIVLVLGGYPLSPAHSIAQAGHSARQARASFDHSHVFASPAMSRTSMLPPASTSGQHMLAHAQRAPIAPMPEALGIAMAFNLFVLGDLAQRQAITYGRIAAGGNATLERYRIGDTLPRARDNRADLIVGGTLIFTDGLVAKGGIVAGGKARLVGVGIPHGRLAEGLPIDFGAQRVALTQIAVRLGQLPPNGITQIRERRGKRKQITLIGSDPQINIFALAGSDLATAQTLIISVPRAASVLVNIDGVAGRITNIGFAIGSVSRQHILYNFYAATDLTLDDDRIQGSILAPQARVTFAKARVNGTLIAAMLTGSGVAWPDPFIGQLPPLPGD
jgi:choice-of-anchor A domain-containing protein